MYSSSSSSSLLQMPLRVADEGVETELLAALNRIKTSRLEEIEARSEECIQNIEIPGKGFKPFTLDLAHCELQRRRAFTAAKALPECIQSGDFEAFFRNQMLQFLGPDVQSEVLHRRSFVKCVQAVCDKYKQEVETECTKCLNEAYKRILLHVLALPDNIRQINSMAALDPSDPTIDWMLDPFTEDSWESLVYCTKLTKLVIPEHVRDKLERVQKNMVNLGKLFTSSLEDSLSTELTPLLDEAFKFQFKISNPLNDRTSIWVYIIKA